MIGYQLKLSVRKGSRNLTREEYCYLSHKTWIDMDRHGCSSMDYDVIVSIHLFKSRGVNISRSLNQKCQIIKKGGKILRKKFKNSQKVIQKGHVSHFLN